MRQWMRAGAGLMLALLLLPGCSGGKEGNTGTSSSTGGPAAGATGNTTDDAKITQTVQAKLDAEPGLKAAHIQAKATGGQVELNGKVNSIADKDKAEALANEAIKDFSSVNAGVVDNIEVAEGGASPETGGKPAGGGK